MLIQSMFEQQQTSTITVLDDWIVSSTEKEKAWATLTTSTSTS